MPTAVSRSDPVLEALRWKPPGRGGTPLYIQLKRCLIDLIERGEIRSGQRIPSERQLARHLGISRMTVRQALVELVQESVLTRRLGRGTFVADRKIEQGLVALTSFSEDMRRRGMQPGARLLGMEVQEAPPRVERALALDPDRRVLVIRRLRLADGIPMALETSHLPYARVPSVPRRRVAQGSLYEYLQEELGIALSHAHQTLEPVLATESEARLLGVEPGSPLLLMERTTYDVDGRPVEFVRSLYRGDRYKFYVELRRERPGRGEDGG
ncbi:MAG TPA: GntR family transcriptional regulator [Limnochordales bacterium]